MNIIRDIWRKILYTLSIQREEDILRAIKGSHVYRVWFLLYKGNWAKN